MHGPGAELVGVDDYGNKYFQKMDAQIVRHRWVVYAKPTDYRTQDPSAIPAEWHAWLHHISDENPANSDYQKPIYAIEARSHPSMTADRYMPKGAWENPNRRTWRKYEAWNPPTGKK